MTDDRSHPGARPRRPARTGTRHQPRGGSSLRPGTRAGPADGGTVTAETAVLLPALVLLLAVLLAAAAAGMTLIRYEEAARASARAAARGESTAVVRSTALRVAGEDAVVHLDGGPGTASVTVTGPAPGVLGSWGGWQLRADASAATEGAAAGSGAGGGADGGPGG